MKWFTKIKKTRSQLYVAVATAGFLVFAFSACSKIVTQAGTNSLSKSSSSTVASGAGGSGSGGSNGGGSGGSGTGSGSGSGTGGGSGGGGTLSCWQGALTAFLGISSAEAQEPAVCTLGTSQFIDLLVPALAKNMASNVDVTNQIQTTVKAEVAKAGGVNPLKLAAKYGSMGPCVPVPPAGDLRCPIAVLPVPNAPVPLVDPKRCLVSLVSPLGQYQVTSIEQINTGGGTPPFLRYYFAGESAQVDFAPVPNPPNGVLNVPVGLIPRLMASGVLATDPLGVTISGPMTAFMSCW